MKFTEPSLLPESILGMQVKTPAQLGKYVSLVLNAMGKQSVSLTENKMNGMERNIPLELFYILLTFQKLGMYLTVNKLNYYLSTKENPQLHVLKDVSFYLKPGMMCLVLGAPGGGKSSLFKVLGDEMRR
jgi:ABC-type bacteriocin/lantibiotic exporter with double-glycine peptidase domain